MTLTSPPAQAMLVRLQDVTHRCRAELVGRSREEVVLEYVRHSLSCPHGAAPVALDDLLERILVAQAP